MKKILIIAIISTAILFLTCLPQIEAQDDSTPPIISLISPIESDEPLTDTMPTVKIEYSDDSEIDAKSVVLLVDNIDTTDWDETTVTQSYVAYIPPEMFQWKNGDHMVQITVSDIHGNKAMQSWTFIVDTGYSHAESTGPSFVLQYIILGTIIVFATVGAYILYLKKTKKFTFEKFFARHPIEHNVVVIAIPVTLGFFFTILSLTVFTDLSEEVTYATEYIIVLGIFIAIAPYAIDSQLQRRKIGKYERAFSQFLFEIADAMRGGLDPAKAMMEISKIDTSILKKHLKIASDNIRLGRPFDEVMKAMARPIKSKLINRYSSLIGDTSKIGGETSQVIHRAAKDMDDFIKVEQERRRQLTSQTTVIYVAFGVMLIVIFQLISMSSELADFDIGFIQSGLTELSTGGTIARMSPIELKQRFLDLLIINSIGTGTIIGSFIDGHIKFGLVHSLIMTAASVVFFFLLIA